jgi:hypothetical protein
MKRPRPWSTGDAGSFAQRTLAVRVPKILEETVADNAARGAFPEEVIAACRALHEELVSGTLRGLIEQAPDRASWDAACEPHLGKSWLDIPWYFAESFFYRRLLEAVQYFGARRGADPFLGIKEREEQQMLPRVRRARDAARDSTASSPEPGADAPGSLAPPSPAPPSPEPLLLHSLWGNRADLSYAAGRAFGEAGAREDLLVDDTARALSHLAGARSVALLLDNAGTELAFALLLAEALARPNAPTMPAREVTLLAKEHPFFVSDATPTDVERTRRLLDLAPLPVIAHPYLTSSGFFFEEEMPTDLVALLAGFDLVIVKGDANYRRLVGDAPWPPTTPADEAMSFPAPLLALRTAKAEVAVGLTGDAVARARTRDPEWLVNGRFGFVQLAGLDQAARAAASSSRAKGP